VKDVSLAGGMWNRSINGPRDHRGGGNAQTNEPTLATTIVGKLSMLKVFIANREYNEISLKHSL